MVELKDVSFRYGSQKTILKGAFFKASEGRLHVILGRNGTGKTTVLDLMFGFLKPQEGHVYCMGKEVKEPLAGQVSYLISDSERYFFERTVLDEVLYPLRFARKVDGSSVEKARRALWTCGIPESMFDRDPLTLSKGERRRVAIASVLVSESNLVLLDEPSSGLDSKGKKDLVKALKALVESGKTVIATAQSIDCYLELRPRAFALHDGKLNEISFDDLESSISILKKSGVAIPERLSVAFLVLKRKGVLLDLFADDVEFAKAAAGVILKS